MTFEEYKRHFEMFGKIDTAEKISVCEQQYQRYLLHMENENYFEPVEDHEDSSIVGRYKQNLCNIFQVDKIKEDQIYLLITPSFEPESLLIIERQKHSYNLVYTKLMESYWTTFYTDNKVADVGRITSSCELKKDIGDSIFKLLTKTIGEARKPEGKKMVLDGTMYRVSAILNGMQKVVSQHSPDESSRSGKVIAILEQLIEIIEHLDSNTLLSIKAKIEALEN